MEPVLSRRRTSATALRTAQNGRYRASRGGAFKWQALPVETGTAGRPRLTPMGATLAATVHNCGYFAVTLEPDST